MKFFGSQEEEVCRLKRALFGQSTIALAPAEYRCGVVGGKSWYLSSSLLLSTSIATLSTATVAGCPWRRARVKSRPSTTAIESLRLHFVSWITRLLYYCPF
jgi:hypothetical protein